MEFYKISAMVKVPEEDIEAVVPEDGSAQKRFMKAAREKGKYYRVASNHSSVMTLIITDRGDIYGAPYLPQTYAKRLTPGTCLLRTDCGGYIVAEKAVQVVSSPNASFKRKFKECKDSDMYLCLSGKKQTCTYLAMESGMLYGCHGVRESSFGR